MSINASATDEPISATNAPRGLDFGASRFSERRSFVLASQVLLAVGILAAWEGAARADLIQAAFFGQPTRVVGRFGEFLASGAALEHSMATLRAALTALAIGIPMGVAAGALLGMSPFINKVFGPLLVPLNSLPRLAFAPIFVIWFGLSMWAKVALAFTLVFFIMLFNTRAGVRGVDPDMVETSRMLGLTKRKIVWKVALPNAIPSIVAGARLSVTWALLGTIGSELIAARDGLGVVIVRYANAFDINGVFAVLIVLAAISTLLAAGAELAERRLLRWQ